MISYSLGNSEALQHLRINASCYVGNIRYVKEFNFYIQYGFAFRLERMPDNFNNFDVSSAAEKIKLENLEKVVRDAANDWYHTIIFMENLKETIINNLTKTGE